VSSFSGMNIREIEVHFGAKLLGCPTNAMAQNQNGKWSAKKMEKMTKVVEKFSDRVRICIMSMNI